MSMSPLTSQPSPQYSQFKKVNELVDRFHRGELDYLPEDKIEQIAMLAAQHGIDFRVPGKPVKKALFDFADTTLLGLLPNKWRPTSVGQEWHGESGLDRFAGGVGTAAGMVLPVMGAVKATKWAGQGASSLWNFTKNKMGNLNPLRDKPLTGAVRHGSPKQIAANPIQIPGIPHGIRFPGGGAPRVLGGRTPSTPNMTDVVDIMRMGLI